MSRPLLYSANPWLKYHIQTEWKQRTHFVWCSEVFDGTKLSPLERGAFVSPSSNPADIYRELSAAIQRHDQHCARIRDLRLGIKKRAVNWATAGEISEAELQEIIALADSTDLAVWKPLLYIIPRAAVSTRLEIVPAHERAGTAIEYRIADLRDDEFDVIQL